MAKKVEAKKKEAKKAAEVKSAKKTAPAKKAAPVKKEIRKIKEAPKKEAPAEAAKAVKPVAKVEKAEKKVEEKKEPPKAAPLDEIKVILLKRRGDLLKEILESRVRESDSLKREIGDIYDEASIERDRELSLLLGDRDRQKLYEIDEALKRIESGEYGICENCGEKIAPGRLKAHPFARLCINCKAEEERQEARKKRFEVEGVYRNLALTEEES
jgi:DnaK suppressor protein